MRRVTRKSVLKPATVAIVNLTCVPDGTGTGSNLTFVLTILRTAAESIEERTILIDGSSSAISPNEQAGSPSTPSPGLFLHSYDCSTNLPCGSTYRVQAFAKIATISHAASPEHSIACPCVREDGARTTKGSRDK